MVDATISRARLRDLARLGRSQLAQPGKAGPFKPSASRRRPGTDAGSIAARPSVEPQSGQLTLRNRRPRGINHRQRHLTLAFRAAVRA
jgi:hypothetical protein